jgi:hypothetical protein
MTALERDDSPVACLVLCGIVADELRRQDWDATTGRPDGTLVLTWALSAS